MLKRTSPRATSAAISGPGRRDAAGEGKSGEGVAEAATSALGIAATGPAVAAGPAGGAAETGLAMAGAASRASTAVADAAAVAGSPDDPERAGVVTIGVAGAIGPVGGFAAATGAGLAMVGADSGIGASVAGRTAVVRPPGDTGEVGIAALGAAAGIAPMTALVAATGATERSGASAVGCGASEDRSSDRMLVLPALPVTA